MDDKELATLIQRVLLRIQAESATAPVRPKAYLILPEHWREQSQSQCMEILRNLQGGYHTIAVLPDGDDSADALYAAGICAIAKRGELTFPAGDFLSVFPIASRNLVVKAALCLQDDFESAWISKCIASGNQVFMPRESPLFTGNESTAYQRKISAYYREAEAFGIQFDSLPQLRREPSAQEPSGRPEQKRIITARDLTSLETNELWLRPGDTVTALAAERAEELGIQIHSQKLTHILR